MKKQLLLIIILLLQTLSFIPITVGDDDWIIDGDKVYIDDEYVYLSAQPHTIIESTWVEFTLISKQYTGDIDVVWGFDHDIVRPKTPQRWNGTAYNTWNKEFITRNVEFGGCNKWYILTDLPVVEDVEYKVRAWMHVVFNTTGKYWFAVKPSGETLQQAIASGHLYYLDPWWDSNWNHYRTLTIESDYIGSTLNSFPCLVVVPTAVGSTADGGNSIRFLATDHVTTYDYEIESWDGASNSFVWVEIPEISSATDTQFIMYYNNTAATDNQNPTGVWDANFISVYHGADWTDSTSNYYNLSTTGTPTLTANTQMIGSCMNFTGNSDRDYAYNDTYYDISTGGDSYTIECWMIAAGTDASHRYAGVFLATELANANGIRQYEMGLPATPGFQAVMNDDVGESAMSSTTTGQLNQSYYIATTYTPASGSLRVNDSSEDTYAGQSHDFTDLTETNITLGFNCLNDPDDWLMGELDEVRISKTIRTADWLNACFHNQNRSTHLGDFLDMGVETNFSVSIYAYTPASGTENVSTDYINTSLSATVNHTLGKNMVIKWYSNSSGTWELFNINTTSGNATEYTTNSNFTGNGTIYYWNLSVEEDTNITGSNIYWFRTWYVPLNPTGIDTDYATPNLNISWTTGTYADTTVLIRNNDSIPASVTDGVVYYNGTLEYFVDDDVDDQCYFRLYSYNSTRNIYSTGVNAEFGGLEVNVYNESDPTVALVDWDLFVTNESGSETYENNSNNNPHVVNYSSLPIGTNIVVQVNATGYKTRYYYIDLSANLYFTLQAFLPPTTDTEQYKINVLGPLGEFTSPPIENAKLEIKRYLNGTFQDVSIIYTDANGQCFVDLIPNEIYKILISKDGYVTEDVDMIPREIVYAGDWEYTYRLTPTSITPPTTEFDLFWSDVTFTGTMYLDNTIIITYIDSNSSTIDTQIYLYELYNGSSTLNDSNTKTGNSNYQYTVSNINSSRLYQAVLYFNNTANYGDATSPVSINIYPINISIVRTPFDLEARIEGMFGPGPLGPGSWCPSIAIIPAIIILCSFGPTNVGGGIFGSALTLGLTNLVFSIWLTNPFPVLLLAAIGFIIAIGVIYMWAKEAGDRL